MHIAVKTHLSLSQRQPANADLNLAADDMTHRTFNHAGCDFIKYKQILIGFFFSLLEAASKKI